MDARPVTRRGLLIAASVGVVAAAGCTGDGSPSPAPTPDTTSGPTSGTDPDPDAPLLSAARRDEARVFQVIEEVRLRHRALRPPLTPLLDHHRTHLDVLDADIPARRSVAVPAVPAAAVLMLQRVETISAQRRRSEAVAAQSGELARYLASMSASSAQHVVVLETLARDLSRRGTRG